MPSQLPLLIIPAFNPDKKLLTLLTAHQKLHSGQACLVVNDGSKASCDPIFKAVQALDYTVLHHQTNQGKGAALKTAMQYYITTMKTSLPGLVTADADGQHALDDIMRLSHLFLENDNQDKLILGVRKISKMNIPFRSRIGNTVTRFLFNSLTKSELIDTQTGLRAIPNSIIELLLQTKSEGYEFEFEMFFIAKKAGVNIEQMPIETIYIEDNKDSHFNPLRDSIKIYSVFIRYKFFS